MSTLHWTMLDMKLRSVLIIVVISRFVVSVEGSGTVSNEIPSVEYSLATRFVNRRPISRIEFICHLSAYGNDSDVQSISWYMDNALKYRSPYLRPNGSNALHLTEAQFVEHGLALGHMISCSIDTIVNGTNHTSPTSNGFFVGIKILTPIKRIQVGETNTSKLSITLQTTIPIGCTGTNTCYVWLTTYNPFHMYNSTCSFRKTDLYDTCGILLHSNTSGTFDVPIGIFHDGQFAQTGDYEIALKTESTAENDIWKDYILPRVKVQITNDNDMGYNDSTCFNLFKVTTFDGRKFTLVPGVYTLYYNSDYKTEVQIRTVQITFEGKSVVSTCAVAIMAGKDIYTVDYCSIDYQESWKENTNHALSVKTAVWNSTKVCFPYGTCVQISEWRLTSNTKGLVVAILSTPADWAGKTRGLCGVFNNNCFDEFHYRSGDGSDSDPALLNGPCDLNTVPTVFINSWRVKGTVGNYITGQYNLTTLSSWTFRVCICHRTRGTVVASNIQGYVPCTTESVDVCTIK